MLSSDATVKSQSANESPSATLKASIQLAACIRCAVLYGVVMNSYSALNCTLSLICSQCAMFPVRPREAGQSVPKGDDEVRER